MIIKESFIGIMHGHYVIIHVTTGMKYFVQTERAAPGSTASYNTVIEHIDYETAQDAIRLGQIKGGQL